MEEFMKGVLKEILEVEEHVIDDLTTDSDLIEIGLDSLKAIELIVYIEDEYGVMFEDDDLFIDNLSSIEKIEQLVKKYLDN